MLTILKVVALVGALLVPVTFTKAPAPVHRCYTPSTTSLEIGQCELALLQFNYTPRGGIIRTGNTHESHTCGGCAVTLATLDGKEKITTSLLNSLDAVRDAFELCRGYGTVVISVGEHQSSTNLTLALGNAPRCNAY